jgi:2EXR family
MVDQPHLQLFNLDSNNQDEDQRVFHLFPQLIPELRLKIWRHAFQNQRIINVHLQAGSEQVFDGETKWVWGNIHSTSPQQPYGVFVSGYQLMNNCLRVCRESRAEVLRFYRLHIPCRLTSNFGPEVEPDKTKPGTIYVNPEHDFLHISSLMAPLEMPEMFFVDFVTRLKRVYDPRHIGLLNLVLDSNDISRLLPSNNHGHRYAPVPELFLETIKRLQEVWLLQKQAFGRLNLSLLSGTSSTDIFFTRSFPIIPLTPNFELFGPDPRPISQDLKRLNVDDPRRSFSAWRAALKHWDIPVSNNTSYKFLVAYEMGNAYDKATARKALEREDGRWRNPEVGKGKTVELEDLAKAVKPAFGFWLFPVDAFGPFGRDGEPVSNGETNGREYKDLSAFYPELALSTLR